MGSRLCTCTEVSRNDGKLSSYMYLKTNTFVQPLYSIIYFIAFVLTGKRLLIQTSEKTRPLMHYTHYKTNHQALTDLLACIFLFISIFISNILHTYFTFWSYKDMLSLEKISCITVNAQTLYLLSMTISLVLIYTPGGTLVSALD